MNGRVLTCVYCGHEYPQDTPAAGSEVLTEHIKVCERHPMRKAEADITLLRSALAGLIGADSEQELRTMEATMRLLPAPDADKAVSINAIHALLATMTPNAEVSGARRASAGLPGWATGASTRREHMKPYMVEITTYGVVMAEDEAHAHQVADSYKSEIFVDDCNPRIEVDGAVVKVEDLAHGWDGECIPYGGDGNTKLADLLVPNVELSGPQADLSPEGPARTQG